MANTTKSRRPRRGNIEIRGEPKDVLTYRIRPDLKERLVAEAADSGVTASALMEQLAEEMLSSDRLALVKRVTTCETELRDTRRSTTLLVKRLAQFLDSVHAHAWEMWAFAQDLEEAAEEMNIDLPEELHERMRELREFVGGNKKGEPFPPSKKEKRAAGH